MGEIASRSFEGAFGRAGRTGKDLAHEFKHSAVGRQLPLVMCSCEPTREVSHALWGYVQGQPGAYAGTVDAALYLVMKHGVRTAAESGSTRHFEFGAGLDPGINATCRNIWRTGIWISARRYVASAEVCAHEVLSGVVKDDWTQPKGVPSRCAVLQPTLQPVVVSRVLAVDLDVVQAWGPLVHVPPAVCDTVGCPSPSRALRKTVAM